eukprot:scaffold34101_cov63-Phaeocystis_antarctica.AAC.1
MPGAGRLPGGRRRGGAPHDPHWRSLHEQRNVCLRGAYWRRARRARRAAPPPLWPDAAGRACACPSADLIAGLLPGGSVASRRRCPAPRCLSS